MAKHYAKLAQRYAKALMKVVEAEQGVAGSPTPAQQVAAGLGSFADLWRTDRELASSMLNPMFAKDERAAALARLTKEIGLSEVAQRFLNLVFEKDRIVALPEIVDAFVGLADGAAGVVQVQVTVAKELLEQESRDIEARLSQKIGGSLEFSWSVDPKILGGMVVSYSGKVLDGSLGGRLARIERRLMS